MKRKVLFLLAFAAVLSVFSCQKDQQPEPEPVPQVIAVTSVSLDYTSLTLAEEAEVTLVATVLPANATDATVTWSSSQPAVAKVEAGKVTALSEGQTTITAKSGGYEAFCEITVIKGIHATWGSFSSTDNSVINGLGGTEEILLQADGDWTLTLSADASSWLSVSPTSGGAGETVVTVTTTQNGNSGRTATVTITPCAKDNVLTVNQRAYVYKRYQAASGTVTNSVQITYTGYTFTRFFSILPVPQTNMYQDVISFESDGAVMDCKNNFNKYLVRDISTSQIPASGGSIISESFNVTTYSVDVDMAQVVDVPAYDPESEPCKNYLGGEAGDLVTPSNPEIASVADELWGDAGGNVVDYARLCYEWTAKTMKYGNAYTGLHKITELMKTKVGDCGNFCSVFISLLRNKGIPARHVVMIEPDKDDKHVRAEFYLPAYGWIPVDPTFKNSDPNGDYFGKHRGKYVVMSQGINSRINTPDDSNFRIDLLQTYYFWYWYNQKGSSFTCKQVISKFQ